MAYAGKKKLTAAERRAQEDALERQELEKFEKDRDSLWAKFWALAQRLELIRTQCPEFVQEHEWEFEGLQVDVVKCCFFVSDVGIVTRDKLSIDSAKTLQWKLGSIEDAFKEFQIRQQRYERERVVLDELRKSAFAKLTEPERMALSLREWNQKVVFADPCTLNAESRKILDAVMAEKDH